MTIPKGTMKAHLGQIQSMIVVVKDDIFEAEKSFDDELVAKLNRDLKFLEEAEENYKKKLVEEV